MSTGFKSSAGAEATSWTPHADDVHNNELKIAIQDATKTELVERLKGVLSKWPAACEEHSWSWVEKLPTFEAFMDVQRGHNEEAFSEFCNEVVGHERWREMFPHTADARICAINGQSLVDTLRHEELHESGHLGATARVPDISWLQIPKEGMP